MKHDFTKFLVTVLFGSLGAVELCAFQQSGDAPALQLSTDITKDFDFEKTHVFKLTNISKHPIRIWNPASRKGYRALSLRFKNLKTDQVSNAVRREINDEGFWENQNEAIGLDAETITIDPGRHLPIEVQLSGGEPGNETWVGLPFPNTKQKFSFIAEYDSQSGDDGNGDQKDTVWTGRINSLKTFVLIQGDPTRTAHYLLNNGNLAKALEVMKGDTGWVHRVDEKNQAPLHIAAQHAHQEVIEWILENDGNVNAIDEDGNSPLHLCSDIEAIKLVLRKQPDLEIRNNHEQRTPLQVAVAAMLNSKHDAEKEKWKATCELYVEHGSFCDIHSAIQLGKQSLVMRILKDQPEYAHKYRDKSTLRIAASVGNYEVCKYLLDKFDVDVDDTQAAYGYTITMEAVAHPKVVKLLIDNGANLDRRIRWVVGNDATCLHIAARDGTPETIDLMINAGVDIFAIADHSSKQTALDVAALFGKIDNVVAILKHRSFDEAHPETRANTLTSALKSSFYSGYGGQNNRVELVEAIMKKSNQIHLDEIGDEVIQAAIRRMKRGNEQQNNQIRQIVAILRQHGAQISVYSAVAIGDIATIKQLLKENPKSVHSCSLDKYPAIHKAIRMNDSKAVNLLLENGVDIELANKSEATGSKNETPLGCVANYGYIGIAKSLLTAGANVNSKDEYGDTPLHNAVQKNKYEMVLLLLKNGADIHAENERGETPLELASDNPVHMDMFAKFKTQKDKRP